MKISMEYLQKLTKNRKSMITSLSFKTNYSNEKYIYIGDSNCVAGYQFF